MVRYFTSVLALWLIIQTAVAEDNAGGGKYRSPVNFTIALAGNVGEIRSDHFHTGIDIKALKGVGSPILAARDGYVSRVGVSPTGYGNVLYVTHSDGDVSVYAHLHTFSSAIARWVERQQYAKQSYAVDLYPTSEQFSVKAGEQIATLGNSGSSGGPHLHFEIRRGNQPRNIIADGTYAVLDHVAPTIRRVFMYEVDTINGVPVHHMVQSRAVAQSPDGTSYMADTTPFELSARGYFAYELVDYKDGRSNTMGLYSLKQLVDGNPNFSFTIDAINFATTRYVNTFTSYAENKASKHSVIRAYISPNNKLDMYEMVRGRGVISPPEWGDMSMVETTAADDAGNSTELRFFVRRCGPRSFGELVGTPVQWDRGLEYRDSLCRVSIPGGVLYESSLIDIRSQVDIKGVVVVGSGDVALQSAVKIAVMNPDLDESLRSKALLVGVSEDGLKRNSLGGAWSDEYGGVEASVRRLGRFAMAIDTTAPRIVPTFKSGAALPPGRALRFTISDDLSGVDKWRLEVDGEWVLSSYDPRVKLVEHKPKRAATPHVHNVILTVTDAKGNKQSYKAKYSW